jgi:hypothetical protein
MSALPGAASTGSDFVSVIGTARWEQGYMEFAARRGTLRVPGHGEYAQPSWDDREAPFNRPNTRLTM